MCDLEHHLAVESVASFSHFGMFYGINHLVDLNIDCK
jgi:hypothetical protein